MCGISGYISNKNLLVDNNIQKTLNLMNRRGPDSQNFFKKDYSNKELALLHSRLNIIDLNERSNQPYIDNDFIIIFNGEIYNYIELRTQLLQKKYKFKTNSDTEVLLKCYQEYGEKCVDHFIGMWAFAIWDLRKKKLFISRDPFGEKPLYYFINDKGFFFGSEIKFIKSLCKVEFTKNKEQIYKNLFFGYKSLHKTNETFFNNIFYLESSSNLTIDLNLKPEIKKYWKPTLKIKKNMTANEASDGVKEHLVNSLKLRMRADVPVAFCLSGGIDSGLLVSCAKKILKKEISTFSLIDKDERYNESENINELVTDLNIKSNLINLTNNKNDFFDRLKKLTDYHDGPISTISYYIHSFLSENISKQNYRVAISGTGADELFTGYYEHFLLHFQSIQKTKYFDPNLENWKKDVLPNIRNEFLKDPFFYIKNPDNRDLVYESNFNLMKFSRINKKNDFKETNFCDELLRKRMLNELFNEVVPVILKHDDLNSMYYSIENRSPYLDRDLLDFSLTIPPHLLISDGFQKKVLRDAGKGILIDKIRNNKQKKGFNASINSVLDMSNPETLELIFNEKSEISEIINIKKVKEEVNKEFIPNHISKLLFSIITTKFFLEDK